MNTRWNSFLNQTVCRLFGCRLDREWSTGHQWNGFMPEGLSELLGGPMILQCSRCGYAEHHGRTRYPATYIRKT